MKLPKVYNAKDYEQDIYEAWERSGAFRPREKGEPFSIVLPPPNATGNLHIGHTEMMAIEDTIIRHQRMLGKSTLWLPGTDHAAIATNAVMERELEAQGTTRHEIGREEFLKRLHEYVEDSKDTIRAQTRAMGASVDWTRERYTMEDAMSRIVGEVFIKMFDDELIYRGNRIVNWDPRMQTGVADDELEHVEEKTTLYTLQYGPFKIATARPETKFGDKYVVMHPDDKRYKKYKHGDTFTAKWINGEVKATIIKDEAINPEFGTGVMTITPWHDPIDFEIAERHKLDAEQIIDFDGKLTDIAGEFKGMSIEVARPKIVAKLQELDLLVSTEEDYAHNIAVNYRGKGVIEPQIKEQWFIDVNKPAVKWKGKKRSLKEVMQAVIRDGDITILPKRFEKVYFNWIDNLRDWNISRQIWWGHRIPAWHHEDSKTKEVEIAVGWEPPDDKKKWEQDPDTLDTWFSSSLWTWSTLIDPDVALDPKNSLKDMLKKSPDFQKFHPTDVLETGYDILFFWVARMILMTTYVTGQIPFKTVYLHGLVRTKDGQKMSKSHPETTIDPLDMIPKYGTDALRLSLLVGQAPGNDMRMFEEKIASYRNFANKLWNIARYVEGKLGDTYKRTEPKPTQIADHWILQRLHETVESVDAHLERYELGRAYEQLYHFIWDDFADWYIEVSKSEYNASVLGYVLETVLKITHPFAPFVTETIWQTLAWEKDMLISAEWPKTKTADKEAVEEFEKLMSIVREIRHLRTELRLVSNHLYHRGNDFLDTHRKVIMRLTGLIDVVHVEDGKGLGLTQIDDAWLDVQEQHLREYMSKLTKERDEQAALVEKLRGRLKNSGYVKSAPKEVVQQTRDQLKETEAAFDRISDEINAFEHTVRGL